MSTGRIQLISKGLRAPFFGEPELSSAEQPWAGFHFEESRGPNQPISRAQFLKTTIFLCTGEEGVAHRKHRGVWDRKRIEPGSVFIVRRDTEIQAAWTSNSWPTMLLQLDHTKFQHLAEAEMRAIEQSLVSALTTRDVRLASLMLTMREEVKQGCPSGRLFGESVSLALLAYLAGNYATPAPGNVSSLSPTQKLTIAAYVRANLGTNISVTELAGLVDLSPSHFARIFKASFGLTPYRYVMRERIEAAKSLLASTKLSASEIGATFGFASQSHFVKVFREFMGVTPKQYRAGF